METKEKEPRTERKRSVPSNDLDMAMMMTNPTWGTKDVSEEMREAMTKRYIRIPVDEQGVPTGGAEEIETENLWEKIPLTRDYRLSNLSKDDYNKVVWWTEMQMILMHMRMPRSVAVCIDFTAPTLELSQSKSGWFRKVNNTLFNDTTNTNNEPSKRSFFKNNGGE